MKRFGFAQVVSVCLFLLHSGVSAGTVQSSDRAKGVPQYYQAFVVREDTERASRVILRNGLTVLVEEQPILPIAALATSVKMVPVDEISSGMLPLLVVAMERLGDFRKLLRRLGGTLEIRLGADHLVVLSTVPGDKISQALEIHSGLLKPWNLEGEQFRRGQRLLEEESRSGVGPHGAARQELWELAYPGRGGRVTNALLKRKDPGSSWTLEQLRSLRAALFQPNRVTVSVSGAVFREDVLRVLVSRYGRLKNRTGSRTAAQRPSSGTGRLETGFAYRHRRAPQSGHRLLLGYRVPAVEQDSYPLQVLVAAMGKGRGSLFSRYGRSSGSILDVSTDLTWMPNGGLLEIALTPDPGKIDSAETDALALAQLMRTFELAPLDLDRAKALLIKEHYQLLEKVENRAHWMARHQDWKAIASLDEVPDRILAVSAKQVRDVAAKLLLPSNLSLLESFPQDSEPRLFEASSLMETLNLLVPARLAEISKDWEAIRTLESKFEFDPSEFTPQFVRYDLRKTSVLRGPDIFLEENHVTPLIYLTFLYPGGRLEESFENAGITQVALESMLQSVEAVSGKLVWHDLEKLGGELEIINQPDFFGFQVSVLSPHLPTALELVRKWLVPVQIEPEQLAAVKKAVLAAGRTERDEPVVWARLTVDRQLFGRHPYGLSRFGSQPSVESLTSETVHSWASQQMASFHPVIVIRGDIAGTSFLPDLIPVLGNSKLSKKDLPVRPLSDEFLPISAWAGEMGHLVFGFQGPVIGSRDAWVMDVLENLVFLMEGSDLLPNEPKPLLPQLRLFHRSEQSAGAVYLTASVPPEQIGTYHQKVTQALLAFESRPIRRQDFLSAIVETITHFYSREQDGTVSMSELTRHLLSGEKPGFRQEYLSTIKGVQLEEIRALGSRLFNVVNKKGGKDQRSDEE